MSDTKIHARQIAELLTTTQIPAISPRHVAMRDAVLDCEAELIERLAKVADIDLAALSGRLLMKADEDAEVLLPSAQIEA